MKGAIIYLLAITAAEAVTVFVQPVWGIVCHAIVLAAVVVHSAVVDRYFYGHLVLSLALNTSMPPKTAARMPVLHLIQALCRERV